MGRPIHKKYFGNTNTPPTGGEGVLSAAVNAAGAYTTRPVITFGNPDIPVAAGGVLALGTITSEVESITTIGGTMTGYTVGQLLTVDGTDAVLRVASIGGTGGDDVVSFDFTGGSRGNFTTLPSGAQTTTSNGAGAGCTVVLRFRAKAVVITTAGSGYYTAPTASVTQSVTLQTITLTSTRANAIKFTADTGNGDAAVDVIKQVSSRRYKVTDGTTTLVCKLAATGTLAVGEASIIARDSDTNEYYVTKLTAHRALLTRKAINGSAYEFATGASVPWNLTGAVLNTSVKLDNA